MIQPFVDRFMAAKPKMLADLSVAHPDSYCDLVKRVVAVLGESGDYRAPDVDRIHVIDDGDYQGTRLYVIAACGYQPSTYWSIFVDYGSCSGCDTFQAIGEYSADPPTEQQQSEYWTLMLHMVQSMREISQGEAMR